MAKRYVVTLTEEERDQLHKLISSGKASARKLAHARILLKADESEAGPAWPDVQISQALDVGVSTVERTRQRFVEEGLAVALGRRKARRQYQRRLDGDAEAHLIALTCSEPPEGHGRWTLRLLADQMVVLGHVDSVSHETVRQTLKKTN